MRLAYAALSAAILLGHSGVWTCDDHHHFDERDDVTVEITGTSGLDFDARFEDDQDVQNVNGVIPFSADFDDQREFFRAVVDKQSSGSETLCVRLETAHHSKEECSTDPDARVTVTLFF